MNRWQIVRLADAVKDILTGPFGSLLHERDYVENETPLVNPINIVEGRIVPDKKKTVDSTTRKRLESYVLKENDIVIARRGEIGRCAVVNAESAGWLCGTGSFFIRPSSRILPNYLALLLRSPVFRGRLERAASGTTMKNLSNNALGELLVPLPEQDRIVGILDEALAGLDAIRASAEKNVQNARELYRTYANSVLNQVGSGWVERKFDEVCSIESRLVDPRESSFVDMPHVGAGNMVSETGEIIDVRTAREEGLKSGKFVFDNTMVLYSKIRPYLRKACRPDFAGLCSADVYPLVPKGGQLDRDFLFHLLMSERFTEYAISGSDRVGMPKVNRDHLFAYLCKFPKVAVQIELARRIDEISLAISSLESVYIRKLAAIAELKQSLLQKAFSGELTSSESIAA